MSTIQQHKFDVNLLRRPTRVKADGKKLYLYAPSVATKQEDWEVGTVIRILEVHPSEHGTALKVMTDGGYTNHQYNRCTRGLGDTPCDCEKPIEEMPERMRDQVKIILLTDIGY